MKFSRFTLFVIMMAFSISALANQDVINVGNKVYLNMPGEEGFEELFIVNEKGTLTLPEVGNVHVAGKTVQEAEQLIKLSLSTVYVDLTTFYLEVTSRDISVTILGYVNTPDRYGIPEYGNVQMVINAAGGLKPGAQLDKLQLRRGEEFVEFDYKAYLDSGDVRILPTLVSGDILFVPASPLIGNVQVDFDAQTLSAAGDASDSSLAITLIGELHNPGTFSFKPDMTIVDALMRADGVTRYADVTSIRVINNEVPTSFDLKQYLDSGDKTLLPDIAGGTMIYVPIMVEDVNTTARTVYVMGEVQAPGAYEANEQVGLMDILANAGGPTRFAETRQIKILKESGENQLFDLSAYSEGLVSVEIPPIAPGDVIFVPEKTDMNEKSWLKVAPNRAVKVIGAVHSPGRYEWSDEMDLMDLLAHAGGPTKGANVNDIKVIREGEATFRFSLTSFAQLEGEYATLPEIIAGDTVIVEELPHDPKDNKSQWVRQSTEQSIYVMGQVGAAGRYAFDKKFHFLDILAAADGPTGTADIRNIRITHRNSNQARVTKLDLALYFETGDETLFPTLSPGDTIYVPERDKEWLSRPKEEVVRLIGAVNRPGRYTFNDSMTLLDLIAEAGGPLNTAMIDKIVVVNHTCCADQARTFDLDKFMKRPDAYTIPVLRAGDTVFIPDQSSDSFANFWKDTLDVLAVVGIVAGL
ncbi:SLBB domain-containing protein [Alteromonas sp. KUL49]|uniref:polysaccharide biosynthesis/export family protein n=1 Tax=Alteromonas sp. KUL49 TaxID=2480798 RepID=UPI00102EFFD3|nr:SLBB domain-containing protein [Alteromonas sp. KUL49]TAP40778.1 sugar ABC transporter substrate-binding protein [Alteromonas sp. KUL49]GEA10951.1 sugar ABC transporter substrate-binding protein [Alteromonas sp. KUL49]